MFPLCLNFDYLKVHPQRENLQKLVTCMAVIRILVSLSWIMTVVDNKDWPEIKLKPLIECKQNKP